MKELKNEIIFNKELTEELHKPIIRKFDKRKVHSPFIDNIWGAVLADMQLISKFNKEFRFLLCVIDIYSKYVWVIPLKDKNGITITNAFQKNFDESNRKPNKIRVDKGSVFYNRLMKSRLGKIEYQNIKIFLQKVTLQIEEVFAIKKVKNTVPLTYAVNELNEEEIVGKRKRIAKNKSKRVSN